MWWNDRDPNLKWYQKMNFVKNTKDMMVQRVLKVGGSLIFLYFVAKSIPNSIKSYKLRKHEIELEKKRLEIEMLKLEIEQKRLMKKAKPKRE